MTRIEPLSSSRGLMRHVERASAQVRSWPSYQKGKAPMPSSPVDASYGADGRLYICFEDATGLVQGEGGVQAGDDMYPPMVSWEMGAGSMLADDVRALGLALIRLAEDADRALTEQIAAKVGS